MKIKTAELQGAALDWAVAKAQGLEEILVFGRTRPTDRGWIEVRFNPEPKARTARFDPSVNWSLGGPLLDVANITLIRANDEYGVDSRGFTTCERIPQWFAECDPCVGHDVCTSYEWEHMDPTFMIDEEDGFYGPTPLVAICRCFVASKLGEEVDVPEELL